MMEHPAPITQSRPIRTSAPIPAVAPMMLPAPISARGPITAPGSTVTSFSIRAAGWMVAFGAMALDSNRAGGRMGCRQGVNVFVAFDKCEIGWPGVVDGGDIPDQV